MNWNSKLREQMTVVNHEGAKAYAMTPELEPREEMAHEVQRGAQVQSEVHVSHFRGHVLRVVHGQAMHAVPLIAKGTDDVIH